jgi:transposase
MSIFLAEVSERHAHEYIVMVLDGAGWHQANDLEIPENMRLVRLPPYSPELNPAEHLWDEIREKWFPNLVFKTLDAVEDVLEEALHFLEHAPERVARMTGFDWLTSIHLIAT